MSKRKCKFRDEYSSEWTFIKQGRNCYEANCRLCHCNFTIEHGGKNDIKRHIETTKHKQNVSSTSKDAKITNFLIKKNTDEETKIIAAEVAMAFHTVCHHQSFSSNDCTNVLLPTVFPDSKIASKFSSARTKCSAIIKNVLAPHIIAEVVKDINNSSFYSISTDASNHNAEKIFPLIVQYFSRKNGLQIKLLRVKSLPNETSETISNFCRESLIELGLDVKKCVAFGGDNTNTNFGGRLRKGTNNVFLKVKESMNDSMEGVGCPAHILHNAAHTAANVLSIDVEVIVVKAFSYSRIYTVRTEKLKEFCDFVGVQYASVLSHSKTRWLSLMRAVERILKLFEALKSFFASEEKAPQILLDFFNNPLSEAYLYFVHSLEYVFSSRIMKIEKRDNSIIEVLGCLKEIVALIKARMDEKFIPLSVKRCLKDDEITSQEMKKFLLEVDNNYVTCHDYLKKWASSLESFDIFSWMLLDTLPAWEQIQSSCLVLKNKGVNIDDNILFCQWSTFKILLDKQMQSKPEEWMTKMCHEK